MQEKIIYCLIVPIDTHTGKVWLEAEGYLDTPAAQRRWRFVTPSLGYGMLNASEVIQGALREASLPVVGELRFLEDSFVNEKTGNVLKEIICVASVEPKATPRPRQTSYDQGSVYIYYKSASFEEALAMLRGRGASEKLVTQLEFLQKT